MAEVRRSADDGERGEERKRERGNLGRPTDNVKTEKSLGLRPPLFAKVTCVC